MKKQTIYFLFALLATIVIAFAVVFLVRTESDLSSGKTLTSSITSSQNDNELIQEAIADDFSNRILDRNNNEEVEDVEEYETLALPKEPFSFEND